MDQAGSQKHWPSFQMPLLLVPSIRAWSSELHPRESARTRTPSSQSPMNRASRCWLSNLKPCECPSNAKAASASPTRSLLMSILGTASPTRSAKKHHFNLWSGHVHLRHMRYYQSVSRRVLVETLLSIRSGSHLLSCNNIDHGHYSMLSKSRSTGEIIKAVDSKKLRLSNERYAWRWQLWGLT